MSVVERARLTRRAFVQRLGLLGGLLFFPIHSWFDSPVASNGKVFRMLPIDGIRYSRAARNHMLNRVFPSRAALIAELPHRGLIFTIEEAPVALAPQELRSLFATRLSLDRRRERDKSAYETILASTERKTDLVGDA